MRALLLGAALSLAVTPQGLAGSFRERALQPGESRILRLPTELPMGFQRDRSSDVPANLRPFQLPTAPPPNIVHFGPVVTEIRNGHATTYVEGATMLGGNISGSMDGRGAEIILHWPNN